MTRRTQYDALGCPVGSIDAAGNITTTAYDRFDRPTSVVGPDPDGAGNQIASQTVVEYDERGRVALVREIVAQDDRDYIAESNDRLTRTVSSLAQGLDGKGTKLDDGAVNYLGTVSVGETVRCYIPISHDNLDAATKVLIRN